VVLAAVADTDITAAANIELDLAAALEDIVVMEVLVDRLQFRLQQDQVVAVAQVARDRHVD